MSCAVFYCFEAYGSFTLAIWRRDGNMVTARLPNDIEVQFDAVFKEMKMVEVTAWQCHHGVRGHHGVRALELTMKEKKPSVTGRAINEAVFMLADSGLVRIHDDAWHYDTGLWYNTRGNHDGGVRELPEEKS